MKKYSYSVLIKRTLGVRLPYLSLGSSTYYLYDLEQINQSIPPFLYL